ncbi:restriction endonuclease subunit S [Leyella stercorea]|uniref:restriction endonuclease subunit S n=1 Tax=Leyella stercorea TaxID=363265 RepID=UPI003A926D56
MITTINNKHKKLNFSSEREQSQACLNSAEHEKNQGRKVLNVPNLRFKEFQGEWEKTKFGDIAVVVGGGTPDTNTSQYWNGKIQWFTPSEIGRNKYVYNSVRTISEEGLNKSSAKLLPIGTILLSSRATVGECSINKKECTTNQGFQSLIPKENISNEFVYYLIQTKRKDLIRKSCGSTFLEISANEVRKIVVSIPTIKEQDKIAKLLSLLDERIATQNKIIEDLKKLKSAISKKLLCNDKWTTYKIQDIAEIGRGRVISSVEIDRQKNPLYPVYSSQTSNNGIMGYLDNYMFDGEYITWTTDGANAGTVFYRKGKFNCTNVCGTLKIQPKFDCYFVSLVLQQATQKYVSSNLANPKLMNNTMASIKIRMPNIETQKQLSKVFQTLDSCLLVHQRTCKMYLSEKQYLLCQMFI